MTELNLEVFQDLHLRPKHGGRSIRDAILSQVRKPWRHEPDKEKILQRAGLPSQDVIALARDSFNDIDESALVLWEESGSYHVANIVPARVGQLSILQYNTILQDFVERIVKLATMDGSFFFHLTPSQHSLEDWLGIDVANALRNFSYAANKSTGTSHPSDQERWFHFLIDAHRTSVALSPGDLARWFVEVHDWPEDTAHELAIEYEFARALLQKYDSAKP